MTKPKKQKRRVKHYRYTEPAFEPYVKIIGQISLLWNDLHERLGFVFCVIIGGGEMGRTSGIWGALDSDRQKRKMLIGALNGLRDRETQKLPAFLEDIISLSHKIDAFEDDRNNVIHSPLDLMMFPTALNKKDFAAIHGLVNFVTPNTMMMNLRAKKLFEKTHGKGKNLLEELRLYRDEITVYRDYAAEMAYSLSASGIPWPDKLSPPNRGQKKSQPQKKPHPQKK